MSATRNRHPNLSVLKIFYVKKDICGHEGTDVYSVDHYMWGGKIASLILPLIKKEWIFYRVDIVATLHNAFFFHHAMGRN